MSKPDEGTVVIEPVENGWLLLIWETDEDYEEGEEEEEESDEEAGYDPSAAFASAMGHNGASSPHQMVTHLHMHDDGPAPRRYVFHDVTTMMAFVTEKTTEFAGKKYEEQKAKLRARAERKARG